MSREIRQNSSNIEINKNTISKYFFWSEIQIPNIPTQCQVKCEETGESVWWQTLEGTARAQRTHSTAKASNSPHHLSTFWRSRMPSLFCSPSSFCSHGSLSDSNTPPTSPLLLPIFLKTKTSPSPIKNGANWVIPAPISLGSALGFLLGLQKTRGDGCSTPSPLPLILAFQAHPLSLSCFPFLLLFFFRNLEGNWWDFLWIVRERVDGWNNFLFFVLFVCIKMHPFPLHCHERVFWFQPIWLLFLALYDIDSIACWLYKYWI